MIRFPEWTAAKFPVETLEYVYPNGVPSEGDRSEVKVLSQDMETLLDELLEWVAYAHYWDWCLCRPRWSEAARRTVNDWCAWIEPQVGREDDENYRQLWGCTKQYYHPLVQIAFLGYEEQPEGPDFQWKEYCFERPTWEAKARNQQAARKPAAMQVIQKKRE